MRFTARKLCTYTQPNPTRRAIIELDELIRSIYTLRYLRDRNYNETSIARKIGLSLITNYDPRLPRSAGKKELTGRTDIEMEISNQCGRLVANDIMYYNSAILSRLVVKYEGNPRILTLIKKISPAARRHLLMNGHYTFGGSGGVIDLGAIVSASSQSETVSHLRILAASVTHIFARGALLPYFYEAATLEPEL